MMKKPITSTVFLLFSLIFCQLSVADTLYDGRFKRWIAQAEQGKARAQYKLGNAYLRGNEVNVDLKQAHKWFSAAAKQGHSKAEYKLGYMYYLGKGVRKSSKNAFRYFKRSAESGYSPAQFYLAKLYAAGHGTSRDYDEAIRWMQKAKDDHYGPADAELRRLQEAGKRPGSSKPKAVRVVAVKKPKANSPSKKKSAKKGKISSANDIRSLIFSSLWQEKGKPAEHFPSDVNSCEDKGGKLVCRSINLNRSTALADISYSVETEFSKFKKSGKFLASYQVNNLFVLPEDPDDPNPNPDDVPATGLEAKVNMRCELKHTTIKCLTDNLEKRVYKQVETDNYE